VIRVVSDGTKHPVVEHGVLEPWEVAAMTVLMTTVVFLFVISVLGFVGYALVRPFTHLHYRHRSGLWSHLP
jgi:hypothetical protein